MSGPYRVIPLTKGYVAIVSKEDYRRVNRYKWRVTFSAGTGKKHGQPYARGIVNGKDTYMHRFIMEEELQRCMDEGSSDNERNWHVDHKNVQTLDNRRQNLQVLFYVANIAKKRSKPCRTRSSTKSTKPTSAKTSVAETQSLPVSGECDILLRNVTAESATTPSEEATAATMPSPTP